MAAYFGVSERLLVGEWRLAARRPPKVISQTPFISGNCAIEAQVPPGNLLASAAFQHGAAAKAIRPRASKWKSLLRHPAGVKMVLGIHFEII